MNSGLRPRPLSALWGEERKKGPQVKICLLRFCEDFFVCLFSFVGTDVFTSFQYAASRKEKESARFHLGFFIGFESFQKKAIFKLLTTNPSLIFDLCTKMEFISAPLIVWFEELRAGGGAFLWAEISL